ncbi:MAG: hypothetical protein U0529_08065 [Thermoanaerobaculia bacterium]
MPEDRSDAPTDPRLPRAVPAGAWTGNRVAAASPPSLPTTVFLLAAVLLAGLPLRHMGGELDGPHVWRQMDTSRTIRAFREEGVDLLRPVVSWMGTWRVVVLECPLPQAAAALAQRALGTESLAVARSVFFASFLLAAAALWAALRASAGEDVSRWATLAFLATPLAQHYARALVVDLFAVGAGLLAFALAASGLRRGSVPTLALAALVAVPAALVKGPVLLPIAPPLVLLALARREKRLLVPAALLGLVPVAAFALWRLHAEAVNGAAPDWSFIPDYHRMTNMGRWYFGSLAQRLDPVAWKSLAGRLPKALAGPGGAALVVSAALLLPWRTDRRALGAWLAGAAVYVLVFWNLNVVHDYYQLATLPALSLLAAGPLALLPARLASRPFRWLAPLALLGAVAAVNVGWADRHLYLVPQVGLAFGKEVRSRTPEGALVIAVRDDVDARCPLLLEPSRRDGWSVREEFLTAEVVRRLEALGATHLAWVRRGPAAPARAAALPASRPVERPLPAGWTLSLWDLREGHGEEAARAGARVE